MWAKLSIKDKAEIIKMGVANGIKNLNIIKNIYNQTTNKFNDGGSFNGFLNTLPDNQKFTDPREFNMYRYWELNGKPRNFNEAKKKGMFTLNEDGSYHGNTVAYDEKNDRYEFIKSPLHPTLDYELLKYFNSNEMSNFRKNWKLNMDHNPYLYERRKKGDTNLFAEGGISNFRSILSNYNTQNK